MKPSGAALDSTIVFSFEAERVFALWHEDDEWLPWVHTLLGPVVML